MTGWKEGQAAQYEHYAAEFEKGLVELENMEAMLVELDRLGLLTENRSYAGGVRALRADLVAKARELRKHDDIDVLPMSLTTRRAG